MSVWTHIEGTVSIYKKDKVSVRDVICDTLTDEVMIDVKTEDFSNFYVHTINANVCIDGYDFIKCHEKFIEGLKPIKGGLDLSVTLRFL
jgi:hypothetical protein